MAKQKHTVAVAPDRDCRPYESQEDMSGSLELLFLKVPPQQYVVGPILASCPSTVVDRAPPSDSTAT